MALKLHPRSRRQSAAATDTLPKWGAGVGLGDAVTEASVHVTLHIEGVAGVSAIWVNPVVCGWRGRCLGEDVQAAQSGVCGSKPRATSGGGVGLSASDRGVVREDSGCTELTTSANDCARAHCGSRADYCVCLDRSVYGRAGLDAGASSNPGRGLNARAFKKHCLLANACALFHSDIGFDTDVRADDAVDDGTLA
jgi:hypothetical protein